MTHTRCMVLIPAGPDTQPEYLNDTLESVNHHIGVLSCVVAVIDDSRRKRFAYVGDLFPNGVVIEAADYQEGAKSDTRGSLFGKQVAAIRSLMRRYRFDVLLRLDTDALVIGDAPHEDALAFLERRPDVGMVGAFTRRGDGSDKKPAMAKKGEQLTREMGLRRGLKDLALVKTLRSLVRCAEAHGYTRGDMCTGGACFLSPRALTAIEQQGLFDLDMLSRSELMDDMLMALLCAAAGYKLSDLPADRDVLAINWRGLPMPLDALVASNKKIVHPIKDGDLSVEPGVRAFFRERRGGAGAAPFIASTAGRAGR
jgi:hypothetical protein